MGSARRENKRKERCTAARTGERAKAEHLPLVSCEGRRKSSCRAREAELLFLRWHWRWRFTLFAIRPFRWTATRATAGTTLSRSTRTGAVSLAAGAESTRAAGATAPATFRPRPLLPVESPGEFALQLFG